MPHHESTTALDPSRCWTAYLITRAGNACGSVELQAETKADAIAEADAHCEVHRVGRSVYALEGPDGREYDGDGRPFVAPDAPIGSGT